MNRRLPYHYIKLLFIGLLVMMQKSGYAQHPLQKKVSANAVKQPLSAVLSGLEKQAGIYFSYSSGLIPGDSLVTFNISNKPLQEALNLLIKGNYQYKEVGDHIVIQKPPAEKYTFVEALLVDTDTGEPVDNASVYSRTLLVATLSDEAGHFRLKVREKALPVSVSISKLGYADTSVMVSAALPEGYRISVKTRAIPLNEVVVTGADGNFFSRLFVSSNLRAQGRNITNFFVSFPAQASFTPGLGTHGRMSSQVVNKVSLNVLGGYTGGTNGAEVAGLFNVTRKNVRFFQAAGLFNFVSGGLSGFQASGLYNNVQDSVSGMQAAGGANVSGGMLFGVQAAGLYNKASGSATGAQVAGVYNHTAKDFTGFQAASLLNQTKGTVRGAQVSGLINSAGYLKGVQIGVINRADSSSGISIGLVNFIKNGHANVSLSATEVFPVNLAWKTGTRKFYTILALGSSVSSQQKRYGLGLGVGAEINLKKRWGLIAEATHHTIFLGDWEGTASLLRLQPALRFTAGPRISLFAGPSFSALDGREMVVKDKYQAVPQKGFNARELKNGWSMWMGWQVGLSWNYR